MTIEEFIAENLDLIDANEWDKVYEKAETELKGNTGNFTEYMLAADIHPEYYLKELPNHFLHSSSIKQFTIPNNITKIGYEALSGCDNLTSVVISDSVTKIGGAAFKGCHSLESVIIPDNVTMICQSAFFDCTSLRSVIIGDSVTEISLSAFEYCDNLMSVVIPGTVIHIGRDAFSNCGDNLLIEYNGTKKDWNYIYNSEAFDSTYFTVKCIDGDIVKKKR